MSTLRLTFLYPQLFRAVRLRDPAVRGVRNCRRKTTATPTCCHHVAPFSASTTPRRSFAAQRHGTAVEPTPLQPAAVDPAAAEAGKYKDGDQGTSRNESKEASTPTKEQNQQTPPGSSAQGNVDGTPPPPPPKAESAPAESNAQQQASQSTKNPSATAESLPSSKSSSKSTPMQTILHMGPPSGMQEDGAADEQAENNRPPHLTPPPYLHHFDTYSLVKQLEGGGWTAGQAITAMKAVRGLLASNLDVAQAGLVSKSDVENETYLFRAACSELSTEIRNNRRTADEQMRQQRTTLQHEVDILTQILNQEVLTLNDTVRGIFNDRRMAVREEQKAAESAIQQVNYKISVELTSDSKSDIEGLRWVLIRRSVLGIIFMAVLTLGSLRYASYLSHERQKEYERLQKEAEIQRRDAGKNDNSAAPDAAEILAAN